LKIYFFFWEIEDLVLIKRRFEIPGSPVPENREEVPGTHQDLKAGELSPLLSRLPTPERKKKTTDNIRA
jgi:hypothetical protein